MSLNITGPEEDFQEKFMRYSWIKCQSLSKKAQALQVPFSELVEMPMGRVEFELIQREKNKLNESLAASA